MIKRLAAYPEIIFTAVIIAITAFFSIGFNLPFNLPSGERAVFVGVHYLYPMIGLAIWAGFAAVGQKRQLISTFMVALPCYAIVLICHFNIKLWGPHINPMLWDDFFWRTDQAVRPLIDASFWIREAISPLIPLDSNFYMIGFVVMFYTSFCYHALKTPERFRTLFIAALLIQGLGGLAYLIMPAVGPFLYEAGIETVATEAQASMHGAWQANVAGGANWLSEYGSSHLTVGLGAMPSLHAGISFLFLIFAWKYGRVLVIPYGIVFAYICVTAIASRWHYAIDLPVGIAIAVFCSWAAHRMTANAGQLTNKQPE